MIDFLKNKIEDKNILILGFGREGESTYNFLRKYFPDIYITVADKNDEIHKKINNCKTHIFTGENYMSILNNFDIIFKTPGISLNHLSYLVPREKITSQTDIFLSFYSAQIVGITGTKGKSTTSSLLYQIIKSYTDDAVLIGNIGIPAFDCIDNISDNTKIIYELSSHQLEYISKGPNIAVLLNIYQEHLDHYGTFEAYQQAKINITQYQNTSDNLIFNSDDALLSNLISEYILNRNCLGYSLLNAQNKSCWIENDKIHFNNKQINTIIDLPFDRIIKGSHNTSNIMAAVCACILLGIPDGYISEGIRTFKGLEHRLEYVGIFDDIHFYNDSISTIPEATIEAVKTLKTVDTIILGGFDRGIDYTKLIEFIRLSSVRNILLLGKAGVRIYKGLSQFNASDKNIVCVKTLEDAVIIAKDKTLKSHICLLSPAAASYDMFKNFEERGNIFKNIVKSLR